jgi:hypothetical protein
MKITSPVKEFPGTVERPDSLTLPQVIAFENGIRDLKRDGTPAESDGETLALILPFFTDWQIEGQPAAPTVETFIFSPRKAGAELVAWLLGEITKVYVGETEIPNA